MIYYYEDKALISGCVYYDVPRIILWGILQWEIPYISGEHLLWDVSSGLWKPEFVDGVLRRSITTNDTRHTIYDIRSTIYEDKALISRCVYYDVPRILLWGILQWEIPHIGGEFLLWDF